MRSDLVIQNSLQIDQVVLQRRPDLHYRLLLVKGYAGPRKAVALELYLHVLTEAQLVEVLHYLGCHFLLRQNGQHRDFVLIIDEYLMR